MDLKALNVLIATEMKCSYVFERFNGSDTSKHTHLQTSQVDAPILTAVGGKKVFLDRNFWPPGVAEKRNISATFMKQVAAVVHIVEV